jgi:hypothetical protein
MSLKDLIVQKKPRETSGPRSANRFEFQKSWALCRLLELHQSGQDYLIVFDYHDDVLVLDSSTDPNRIDFYQIKTKQSGHWTRSALLSQEQGKDGLLPSILGKLTQNKLEFPEHTGNLTLVSTQGFQLAVKGHAASIVQEVCLKELDDKELAAIHKAIRKEHKLDKDMDCADCTHLTVTSLSLGDHPNHAMGILGQFLSALYPNEKVQLPAIYRALSDEIKRKTNVEKLPSDFAELCSHRSISRGVFEKMLQDVKPSGEFDAAVQEAMTRLQHEDVPFDSVREIRLACTTYEIERMDSSDLVLGKARKTVEGSVATLRASGSIPEKLTEAIAVVLQSVTNDTALLVSVRSESYRTAMILMALYGI